jgi:NitT/TauT family transport system substrate-binding protein
MLGAAKSYAEHMVELKQIRAVPDFATFMDARISDDLSQSA